MLRINERQKHLNDGGKFKMEYYGNNDWRDYLVNQREAGYLMHHGILGQKWGKRNGPPYPLRFGSHSSAEKKANPKGRLDNYDSPGRVKKKRRDSRNDEGELPRNKELSQYNDSMQKYNDYLNDHLWNDEKVYNRYLNKAAELATYEKYGDFYKDGYEKFRRKFISDPDGSRREIFNAFKIDDKTAEELSVDLNKKMMTYYYSLSSPSQRKEFANQYDKIIYGLKDSGPESKEDRKAKKEGTSMNEAAINMLKSKVSNGTASSYEKWILERSEKRQQKKMQKNSKTEEKYSKADNAHEKITSIHYIQAGYRRFSPEKIQTMMSDARDNNRFSLDFLEAVQNKEIANKYDSKSTSLLLKEYEKYLKSPENYWKHELNKLKDE